MMVYMLDVPWLSCIQLKIRKEIQFNIIIIFIMMKLLFLVIGLTGV